MAAAKKKATAEAKETEKKATKKTSAAKAEPVKEAQKKETGKTASKKAEVKKEIKKESAPKKSVAPKKKETKQATASKAAAPEKTAKEIVLENLAKFYENDHLWKSFRISVAKYAGSYVLEQRRFRRLEREMENLYNHLKDDVVLYRKEMFEEIEKLLHEAPVENTTHIKYSKNSDAKFVKR